MLSAFDNFPALLIWLPLIGGIVTFMLKQGERVCRQGWNGKGMWLMLVETPPTEAIHVAGAVYNFLPYIQMKTADNKMVPWLASQTDCLATDWQVAE